MSKGTGQTARKLGELPSLVREALSEEPPSLYLVVICCVLSAALLWGAFPKPGVFLLTWIALVPWLWLLRRLSFGMALGASLVFGALYFGGLLYWVNLFGQLPWVLLALWQGCFAAAAGILIWLCRDLPAGWRAVSTAGIWTFLEWLRGQGGFGFNWGWLGHSQSSWVDVIQLAAVCGTLGISFLIVLYNTVLTDLLVTSRQKFGGNLRRFIVVWLVVLSAVVVGHYLAIDRNDTEMSSMTVGVVQPSVREPELDEVGHMWTVEEIEPELRRIDKILEQYDDIELDLMIFPESTIPASLNREPQLEAWPKEVARRVNSWVLLGAAYLNESSDMYNAAYLYSPEGELAGRYDKVQLVPFGEYVPGRNWLPGLRHYPIREYDLTAGEEFRVVDMGEAKLGVAICFESIFPYISRELVKDGAGLLAVITNDGWFKRTAAPAQHQQMAILRAVETRRWVARSAATGISCFISPQGRVVSELGLYDEGILVQKVELIQTESFYVRYGDWFVVLAGVIGLFCVGWALVVRRRGVCRKE